MSQVESHRAGNIYAAFDAIGWAVPFERGKAVFSENEPAKYVYLVTSGAVRTVRIRRDGRRQVGAFYLPGEISSIEADRVHHFTAEAAAASIIRVADRQTLMGITADDPDLRCEIWETMAGELRRVGDHILLLGRKSAEERVASFLLDVSARTLSEEWVDLPMSRKDLADYLVLTIETVSRAITQLEAKGAIEVRRIHQVVFTNRTALQA